MFDADHEDADMMVSGVRELLDGTKGYY